MKDFVQNTNNDIAISGNDLLIDTSDQQQQERLLLTEKGNIKQFPMAGVGTLVFLEDEDETGLLREISMQFSADGMTVKKLKMESGRLNVNAPYENS
jgi:hypothetical protein